ncbi:MAG: hypothetical protein KDK60_02685 [Chlamydiia bacterium]|nr:hypothetical protein [Chlamydiia bacterium]
MPQIPKWGWAVLLPIYSYKMVQSALALMIYPLAFPLIPIFLRENILNNQRLNEVSLESQRKKFAEDHLAMPITVTIDRYNIDGVIVKTQETFNRWLVISLGNLMWYEDASEFVKFAKAFNANLLMYNYAGVGRSSLCLPTPHAMKSSHRGMLDFLEEGMEAIEIIDMGWSIGGGVKGQDHLEHPGSKANYITIDYQTFESISKMAHKIAGKFGELAVKFLGWNYSPHQAIDTLVTNKEYKKHIVINADHCTVDKEIRDGDKLIGSNESLKTALKANSSDKISCFANNQKHGVMTNFFNQYNLVSIVNQAFTQ